MTALATSTRRRTWLDRVVDARGDLRAAALLRSLLGLVVVRHLWPDLWASTTPVERFHVPWWSWLPVPSAGLYRLLIWVGAAAGLAMATGLLVRVAARLALAIVVYLLVLDLTTFAHNRAFLVWLLFGVALLPAPPVYGLLRRHGPGVGPLWPVTMLRVVVSSVYLTSGLTKLANPDWRGGLVLWDRVVRHQDRIPFGGWVHDVLTSRAFHSLLSPTAITVELFLGLALWWPRTRLPAIWIALVFHGSIEVTASVQTFSYSAIAATLLWVTLASRDRAFSAPPRLAAVVQRLDWLGRFRVEASGNGTTTLVDRGGTIRLGADARLTALSRLPLLFPIVGPVLALRRVRERRSTT